MEQFDSSEEESSRVLEQQQRNDEQQCPSCAAELTETSVWTYDTYRLLVGTGLWSVGYYILQKKL